MEKLTDKQVADKIIKEMKEYGITPDQMIEVIKLARKKYNQMKDNGKN